MRLQPADANKTGYRKNFYAKKENCSITSSTMKKN